MSEQLPLTLSDSQVSSSEVFPEALAIRIAFSWSGGSAGFACKRSATAPLTTPDAMLVLSTKYALLTTFCGYALPSWVADLPSTDTTRLPGATISANLDAISARETGFFPSSQQRTPSLEKQRRCDTFTQAATSSHGVPVGRFSMAHTPDILSNLRNESAHPKHLGVKAAYEIQFPFVPKISRESRIGPLGDGKSVLGSTEARSRHPRAP
jgi:hypothetical protein